MKDVGKYYTYPFGLHILLPFGIFCGHFDIFFPIWVCCNKTNLATLNPKMNGSQELSSFFNLKNVLRENVETFSGPDDFNLQLIGSLARK
jgi:hypothetical protein